MSSARKNYLHKLYTAAGVYIGTLPPSIVLNTPSFDWQINGGMGEMEITLGLTMQEFVDDYEDTIIKMGNEVRTVVSDVPGGEAMQIYDGYITTYEPLLSEDGEQRILVRVTSTTKTLSDQLFKDGLATSKTYASLDPSNIMKNVLDKYGGVIHYTGGTIDLTGTTVSYAFSYLTYREAVDIILGLCPSFWYWYIDAQNIFYLKEPQWDTPDHTLFIGKEVIAINASKSIEELYNVVYFKGGGSPQLYKKDSRSSSIAEYGTREYKMQDERVTVAGTATTMMTKFLDEHDHPRSILTAVVIDNAADQSRGYDIESLRPGQLVQIKHPSISDQVTLWDDADWDVDYWDYSIVASLSLPMQLIEINYQFDRAVIKLSLTPTDVAHRIEDLNRNLDTARAEGIPSTPS